MFERYSEKARRTIFMARYEASQFGSPYIESEHLLLGLLREDKVLSNRLLRSADSLDAIRQQIEQRTPVHEKTSTSVDLPLSNECKRALAYAAEESEAFPHRVIGTEHLLLGLAREEHSFAAQLLRDYGINAAAIRKDLKEHGPSAANLGATAHGRSLPFGLPLTTIRSADLAASASFYANIGFRASAHPPHDKVLVLTSGPFRLVLFHQSLGTDLLCFTGGNLRSIALELEAEGVLFEHPLTTATDGSQSLLLRDPDGHLVYLLGSPASS